MTDGRTDRWTDKRTDGWTDGGDCDIPDAFLKKRGDKNVKKLSITTPWAEKNTCQEVRGTG